MLSEDLRKYQGNRADPKRRTDISVRLLVPGETIGDLCGNSGSGTLLSRRDYRAVGKVRGGQECPRSGRRAKFRTFLDKDQANRERRTDIPVRSLALGETIGDLRLRRGSYPSEFRTALISRCSSSLNSVFFKASTFETICSGRLAPMNSDIKGLSLSDDLRKGVGRFLQRRDRIDDVMVEYVHVLEVHSAKGLVPDRMQGKLPSCAGLSQARRPTISSLWWGPFPNRSVDSTVLLGPGETDSVLFCALEQQTPVLSPARFFFPPDRKFFGSWSCKRTEYVESYHSVL